MSDDEAIAREVQRAHHADLLLSNPLLTETFAELKRQYLHHWETKTRAHDTDARERLWQAYQLVGMVETHLRVIVSEGRLAGAHLKALAKLGEKPKQPSVVLNFAHDG